MVPAAFAIDFLGVKTTVICLPMRKGIAFFLIRFPVANHNVLPYILTACRNWADVIDSGLIRTMRIPASRFHHQPTRIVIGLFLFSIYLVPQFFNGIFTILGTLVFMVLLSPPVALVVVLLTPASLFVAEFIAKRTFSMFKLQSQIRGEQTALIDETVTQHKTVIAFSQEKNTVEKFDEINERMAKASFKAIFFSSLTNPSTRFVNSTIYAVVALIGALSFGYAGIINISIGGLSSFLSYASQYTKPFNEISGVITELQNSIACAQRVFELIDEPLQTDGSR